MAKIKRLMGFLASAIIAVSACAVSVCADDFSFDMEKAKPTYGGGHAFIVLTRLDNEKRDKNNFNPLWLSEDSEIQIEYKTEGDFEETPIYFIFQSWTGDIVASQEDKWVLIAPTSYDDNKAVWNYETITDTYGSNFSDVYAFVVSDGGTNALELKSITITNVKIPNDEIPTVKGGTVITDKPIETTIISEIESETSITETETETETENKTEIIETKTEVTSATNNADISTESTEEQSSSLSIYILGFIVSGILILVLLILLIVKTVKAKTKGWY